MFEMWLSAAQAFGSVVAYASGLAEKKQARVAA